MNILMYDLAREQSWVTDYWRRILPDIRERGYTDLALYVEQRYHFRSIPQHRPIGGITPAQAHEAGRLCKRFGLRLQWFTNTLGHCDGWLANERFRYLAEDIGEGSQVCPSHPDTRPLLRRMLAEFAAVNPGPILHVGGDEAWALNTCPRCRRRRLSDAELYLDHFRWVIRETKRLGKRPAMWGDMLLKYPKIIPELDRDVLIFDWHYESGSAETIRQFQRHGFEVIPTTATNEYWVAFFPFDQTERAIEPLMRDARELGCPGICQSAWEMTKGALFENQWERIASAPAAFAGRRLRAFPRRFFGSARADESRLRPLLHDDELAKLHPSFRGPHLRRAFFGTDSAYFFHHLHGQPDSRPAWRRLRARLDRARKIARAVQRAGKRRRFSLEHLDLPIEVFTVMCDRIETLAGIRAAVDRLYPHRLPAARGTKLLEASVRRLSRHIALCERLAARFDRIAITRGGSQMDALRLRRQIQQLKTLRGYIRHHAGNYADGVPVPTHELWYV
jgi:hypothetical protein